MNYKKSVIFVLFLFYLLFIQQILGILLVNKINLSNNSLESSNSEGNDSWTKTWSILGIDWASSIAIDSSDNIYVLGGTRNGQTGLASSFIRKFNPMGDFIWEKLLDYNESNSIIYHTIEIDNDNNLFLLGNFENRNNWKDYIILSKFNNSGDFLWNKVLGGYDCFTSNDMAIDLFGNIYLVGSVKINPLNGLDTYIAKFNSSGYILWNYTLGGLDFDEYFIVTTYADNKVYVAGMINDNALILSYNSSGHQYWNYTLSFPYYEQDIAVDSDGYILCADGTNLIKINSTGSPIWNYSLPEYSVFNTKIIIDATNDIYLSENRYIKCMDNSFFLESGCICTVIYLEKINSSGSLLWQRRCTGCADVSCSDIAIDSTNNIYIAGGFKGEFGCIIADHNALLMKNPKAFVGECIEIYYDLIFLFGTPIAIVVIIIVIIVIRKFINAKS